jgi:uncharacterized DUF497 family protein
MIFDDDFEWDELKDIDNQEKHGFSFEEARLIWEGDTYTVRDKRPYPEPRYIAIGELEADLVLFVVYTQRNEPGTRSRVRIISAREAEPNEAEKYYRHLASRRRR